MAKKTITVTVGRIGGDPKKVTLEDDLSVKAALSAVGLNKKDTEIVQVNGDELDQNEVMDYRLKDGEQVVLTRNIEGGKK